MLMHIYIKERVFNSPKEHIKETGKQESYSSFLEKIVGKMLAADFQVKSFR